jgi:glycosyltransferase involved in cell wall biosynthesis
MIKSLNICLVGGEDAHKRIDLAEHLFKNDYKVTILGTKDYEYPSFITFIKYKLVRRLNPWADLHTIFQYRKIIRKNNFDIIQTFDTKPAFLLPMAAFGLKARIVRTITGLGKAFVSNSLRSLPIRYSYVLLHFIVRKKVTHTTFQNTDDSDTFLRYQLIDEHNYSHIYGSGIDLTKIGTPAPRNRVPFTLICVSRLIYEKGIINYLEAAKICVERGLEFKFILVGPLEENSKNLNESILKHYSSYVEWLGVRTDIYDLLRSADAFVLPTFYREGFARVLLEASALGLPLITTDVPGVRDIARHNVEAIIVKTNNSEDLADAIIKLGTDKKLSDQLSENVLQNVKKYSLEVISQNYSTLYQRIL